MGNLEMNFELETFPIKECCVLRLDAGNDEFGNRRLAFVLAHPTGGYLGCSETIDDMAARMGIEPARFLGRILPCIECSPGYRTRLLRIFRDRPRNVRLAA